ncbi:hypothetical protein MSAN_02136700 [Mycena sanguinolenta]|uniref:Uncharacterized protein n=1 Tax=Mycena sanguinolenta TaxID=230812 RepID=A0A8H7CLS2_9AGAR|nr:hypothetical protein MSAN_02136700 [Mycena sanguinolenta]
MSNFEDYVVVDFIRFNLNIWQTTGEPPAGFLFLCPKEDFHIDPSTFCWPTTPAYWSLDPSGIDRLSPGDATQLGFPLFELTTTAVGYSWNPSVYEGLRHFHEAKGFDPYSQDVARHLGYPLYRLSSERDVLPSAYVDSEDDAFDADIDSDCNSAYAGGYESDYPPPSACDDSDLEVDTEASPIQEPVHDPADGNCGSEHTDISNSEGHDASESTSGATQAHKISTIQNDIPHPTLSWSFKCLMATQLALILFLALSWMSGHISISFSLVM